MLQFTDDTIFFCETNVKNITTIKCALRCFELASRLKVIFWKNKIAGIGLHTLQIHRFSEIFNCNIIPVVFKYLGVKIGDNHRRKKIMI